MKVSHISQADIRNVLANHKETKILSNRLRSLLSMIFNHGIAYEMKPDQINPVTHIKKFKEKKVEQAAGTFFTLIESARRNGLNPHTYLHDLFTRLPAWPINRIEELLPDRWQPAEPSEG